MTVDSRVASRVRPGESEPLSRRPRTKRAAQPDSPRSWSRLLLPRTLAFVWAPIAVATVLHYSTPPEIDWVHNVLRRVYYLPIIVAAFQHGLRGGLAAATVVSIGYVPHAFLQLGPLGHSDPGGPIEKALEIVVYNLVGAVAGYLADASTRRNTELRRALDEQQRLQKQLVRAGRLSALGEVVAGIAHEVKNPLHALRGTAEIVDPLVSKDAPERRMWELHVSEIDRLQRVADRFLSFASPHHIEPVRVDLRDVAQRLVELVSADAHQREIDVRIDVPSQAVVSDGDRDLLAQVALNIAVNAMRAIGEGPGTLLVRVLRNVEVDGQELHALRIENDGPPIPDDDIERLFDPFTSGGSDGSGLGLSISERIAEQHGGFIDAANEGLGVAFTVYLPRAADPG